LSYTDGPVVIVKDSDLASDMVVTVPGIKPVMADMQSMFCLRRTALELMDAYNVNAEIQAVSDAVHASVQQHCGGLACWIWRSGTAAAECAYREYCRHHEG